MIDDGGVNLIGEKRPVPLCFFGSMLAFSPVTGMITCLGPWVFALAEFGV